MDHWSDANKWWWIDFNSTNINANNKKQTDRQTDRHINVPWKRCVHLETLHTASSVATVAVRDPQQNKTVNVKLLLSIYCQHDQFSRLPPTLRKSNLLGEVCWPGWCAISQLKFDFMNGQLTLSNHWRSRTNERQLSHVMWYVFMSNMSQFLTTAV